MSYINALEGIDGVRYVAERRGGDRVRIVLEHGAPFEVVDEIRDVAPAMLEIEEWGATQEHFCAIDCRWVEERIIEDSIN